MKSNNFHKFFYYTGHVLRHVGLVDQIQEIMLTFHSSEVVVVARDKIFLKIYFQHI